MCEADHATTKRTYTTRSAHGTSHTVWFYLLLLVAVGSGIQYIPRTTTEGAETKATIGRAASTHTRTKPNAKYRSCENERTKTKNKHGQTVCVFTHVPCENVRTQKNLFPSPTLSLGYSRTRILSGRIFIQPRGLVVALSEFARDNGGKRGNKHYQYSRGWYCVLCC